MRSSIIAAAAFAASAVAVPYAKPGVVVEYATDVVYETKAVTVVVTEGAAPPAAPTVAAVQEEAPKNNKPWHWPHNKHTHRKGQKPKTSAAPPPAYSPEAPAPAPPAEKPSTYEAPAPAPSPEQPAPSPKPKPKPSPEPAPEEPKPSPKPKPAPAPSTGSGLGGYEGMMLDAHNLHRSNHSAPALEWNSTLAAIAQKIGQSCVYDHQMEVDGVGYGQNIAAGIDSDNADIVITDLFYNQEYELYNNFGKDVGDELYDNFHAWGHLTQILWKDSTSVGCATVSCPNGLANTGSDVPPVFTVCNYNCPGNYRDGYKNNVLPPIDNPLPYATCEKK